MTVVMDQKEGKNFSIYNSDCVKFAQELPDNSIDFSIFSPPYSSLYVYSESAADMGNVDDDSAFCEQYRYLVRELFRVTRPGRLVAIHVKDLVYYQGSSERGTSGLRPFSDMCTQVHMEEGFDFHCRVTIFRDPVLERSKTNAHGLLWKTFKKDAEEIPLICWQELASPVWNILNVDAWNFKPYQSGRGDFDLTATDVLNVKQAKDENAEKHLCPMPLNITERALNLWTNAGDVVFSPFAGIGSEGVATLRNNRKFIGTELNPVYYSQAVKHLEQVEKTGSQTSIFDVLGVSDEL